MTFETDPTILVLQLLKNNWSLNGDFTGSNVFFSTRWYDNNVIMPQITISTINSTQLIQEAGSNPLYKFADVMSINIWVRPKQDSNSSLGWAKNAVYQLRKEIDKILLSGSNISTGDTEQFLAFRNWVKRDEFDISKRPVILRLEKMIIDYYYRNE